MLKSGKYIDFKWYKMMMDIFNFNASDIVILDKIYDNFKDTSTTKRNLAPKI